MDYLYDGSFEGLLTCLYYNFTKQKASGIFQKKAYQESLLESCTTIKTNEKQADYMYAQIKKHLSRHRLKDVYYCYLSEQKNFEKVILDFVDLCFRKGARYALMHSDERVFALDDLSRKVSRESHRYTGFTRFKQVNQYLYASIHPTFFILPLLGNHFADRYYGEQILIHDEGRSTALIAQDGRFQLVPLQKKDLPDVNQRDEIEELWKTYFDHIAIEQRISKKRQQQFIPLKYQKDLLECRPSENKTIFARPDKP
ncbi:MAG TPA: hypothetical protein DHN33_02565 [Eubacteriaceae bacterium]|nr:hypothetical protein [Eubacteriaceae bacterium]